MADPYDRVDLGLDSSGRPLIINARTEAMLDVVEGRTGLDVTIVQGSYMAGVGASASAGTHDCGGCIDIRTRDFTEAQREEVLLELRRTGFAAWYRTPEQGFDEHIHAVAIGDRELDPSAQAQVDAYYAGLNGLADGGPDDGPDVPIQVFDFYADDVDGPDAFDMDEGDPVSSKDQDHDGLTDEFERLLHTDVHLADTDHDGLSDLRETTQTHTDPLLADTNDDGVTDKQALARGFESGDAALPKAAVAAGFGGAASLDSDKDGLSDLTEAEVGSDANRADSDADGIADGTEHRIGSNLLSIDSDGDGVADYAEMQQGTLLDDLPAPGTDPGEADDDYADLTGG